MVPVFGGHPVGVVGRCWQRAASPSAPDAYLEYVYQGVPVLIPIWQGRRATDGPGTYVLESGDLVTVQPGEALPTHVVARVARCRYRELVRGRPQDDTPS